MCHPSLCNEKIHFSFLPFPHGHIENRKDVIADIDTKQAKKRRECFIFILSFSIYHRWIEASYSIAKTPTKFMQFNFISQSDSFDRCVVVAAAAASIV